VSRQCQFSVVRKAIWTVDAAMPELLNLLIEPAVGMKIVIEMQFDDARGA
jgi:hypothetical protein